MLPHLPLFPTVAHEPCLHRARDGLFPSPPGDAAAAATVTSSSLSPGRWWETGLSFDELRNAKGASFLGIPGRADTGEPICSWMLSDFRDDAKVREQTMKFIASVPLNEAMARRTYLDVSIRTTDDGRGEEESGAAAGVASTAVIVEYNIPRTVLGRWWDGVVSLCLENVLALRLWRQGSLPEELFFSDEWARERGSLIRRARVATRALANMHELSGPQHRHWYVSYVATRPDLRGRGYGSELLQKICEMADQERADCYLECGLEASTKFFERFGFVVVASCVLDSGECDDVDDGTTDRLLTYGMVRTFQASTVGHEGHE